MDERLVLSDDEIRRDEILRRMLMTPPQPKLAVRPKIAKLAQNQEQGQPDPDK